MSSARITDLLRLGPGERIVWQRDMPRPAEIARHIVSFANTRGGTIVFGLAKNGAVEGVSDPKAAQTAVAQAVAEIKPPLLIDAQPIVHDGATLLVVDVPQGQDTPYVTGDGRVLVRSKGKVVGATAAQAAELAQRAVQSAALVPIAPAGTQRLAPKTASPTVDLEHILLKLERLIIANAELTRKLDQSNSWQSRVADQLIGAAIGLVVSVVVYWIGIN